MSQREVDGAETPRYDAVLVAEALGAAWTTHRLYPNPVGQPAFARALESMAVLDETSLVFEVGPGALVFASEEIETDRDGVERLAKQLYVRDVEAIRLHERPTAQDLDQLFRLVAGDEDPDIDVTLQGALEASGVTSIAVRQRALLGSRHAEGGPEHHGGDGDDGTGNAPTMVERRSEIAAIVEKGADPASVAELLMERAAGDLDAASTQFLDAYQEIHDVEEAAHGTRGMRELFTPYWHDDDPGRIMRTFVEVLFLLPRPAQIHLISEFVTTPRRIPSRVFLDQISGAELADFAAGMTEEAYQDLIDYIRESADVGGPGQDPMELLPLLESAHSVKESRTEVTARIGLLAEASSATPEVAAVSAEALRVEIEEALAGPPLDLDVLRALSEVEHRQRRFRRLMRIWAGRVAAAARRGDFDEAITVASAVREHPQYAPEHAELVNAAITGILSRDAVSVMVERVLDQDAEVERLAKLLDRLGGPTIDLVVELLAEEESQQHRRVLIDLLVPLGKNHLRKLIRYLSDSRWFMVRNLAFVLGKSGDSRAAPPLKKLLGHSDHRVRVEALRAVVPLLGDEAADVVLGALEDENDRVRNTAATLLTVADSPGLDDALLAVLEEGSLGADELQRIAMILVERGKPEVRAAMQKMAFKSFAVRNRAARLAVKTALERR